MGSWDWDGYTNGVLNVGTGLMYVLSAAAFGTLLFRDHAGLRRLASLLLLVGLLGQAVALFGTFWASGLAALTSVSSALYLICFVTVVAYLISILRFEVISLGAFLLPVVSAIFFVGIAVHPSDPSATPVRSALLLIHVASNVLGLGAFALAFAAGLGYLIQERLLRERKVSGVFQRLPSLGDLDALGLQFIAIGFPLLTVGLITGTLWATRPGARGTLINADQGFAFLAWAIFGVTLALRYVAGWRGRRAAWGTVFGFACTFVVVLGYMMRAGT